FNSWNADKMSKEIWKQCGITEATTTRPFDEYTEMSGMGLAARQNEFQNAVSDVVKQGYDYRINQFIYGINMAVSQMALMSKDLKKAIASSKAVAESLYNTREILHADVFANAFSSTVGLLPDGQPMCTAAGKLVRGGTMDNLLDGVSFVESGVEAGFIRAHKMPGGHGIPVGVSVQGVVIPPEYEFDAIRLFKSQQQSGTANNAINALREKAGASFKVTVNRFLASASNWFLETDAELGVLSLVMQEARVEEVGLTPQKAVLFYGSEIRGIGVVNRRKFIGSDI
ncbi:MAG TPA: hypothetical protein VEJ18_10555, partial [Planctomycetota bacterium]|nr:hypothetical protein [Planctomycetota bacterium]